MRNGYFEEYCLGQPSFDTDGVGVEGRAPYGVNSIGGVGRNDTHRSGPAASRSSRDAGRTTGQREEKKLKLKVTMWRLGKELTVLEVWGSDGRPQVTRSSDFQLGNFDCFDCFDCA